MQLTCCGSFDQLNCGNDDLPMLICLQQGRNALRIDKELAKAVESECQRGFVMETPRTYNNDAEDCASLTSAMPRSVKLLPMSLDTSGSSPNASMTSTSTDCSRSPAPSANMCQLGNAY